MTTNLRQRSIAMLTALLVICATVYLTRGLVLGIDDAGSWDLRLRASEYRLFSQHIYPDTEIASKTVPREYQVSVYPPYAYPMFAPFFAFGSILAAKFMFWAASLAALLAISIYGFRELRGLGPDAAKLGAVASLAIAHNSTAIAIGQFSIICMGLVVLQLHCLRRDKVLAAGFFWALAMVKPQIGLVFAVPFLVDRRWRGLAFGVALLAGLSWFTCIYTNVSLLAVIDYWFRGQSYSFITGGGSQGSSTGGILAAWGVDPRIALFMSLLVAAAVGAFVWSRVRHSNISMLVVVAVCAIIGRVFIPHRAYDNIMLFPALIAILALALDRKSVAAYAVAAVFGISLWVPITSLVRTAWVDATLLMVWLAAAAILVLAEVRRAPQHG